MTTVEQVAFDIRRDELLKLVRECPDELREELMSSLLNFFCLSCWRTLEEDEICHCDNDE